MTQGEHAATLAELLDDPIIDILLHGDGLSRDELASIIEDARHKLHHDPGAPEG
ncbi:hypothetical protein [Azospirillum sp.]|uniref:hypothetical protein n=1 Tax=Azospirillum sp. TaxID=34012 RepID=UPI003D73D545